MASQKMHISVKAQRHIGVGWKSSGKGKDFFHWRYCWMNIPISLLGPLWVALVLEMQRVQLRHANQTRKAFGRLMSFQRLAFLQIRAKSGWIEIGSARERAKFFC